MSEPVAEVINLRTSWGVFVNGNQRHVMPCSEKGWRAFGHKAICECKCRPSLADGVWVHNAIAGFSR